jgi:predicted  nucleic acid-binding Zn-ribbon protein
MGTGILLFLYVIYADMAYRLDILRIKEELEEMKKTVDALESRVDAIEAALDSLEKQMKEE